MSSSSLNAPGSSKIRWWRWAIYGVIILAFVLGAAYVGLVAYGMYRVLHDGVPGSLAEERVARMLTQYMEWHAGAWPKSWDDLEDAALVCAPGWDFDDLRRRVDVDFTVDPADLTKAPPLEEGSPSQVLWQRSGLNHCLNGVRPNRFVWDYVQERARRGPDYRPPPAPGPDRTVSAAQAPSSQSVVEI